MNILYINHYAGSPSHGMEYRTYYLAREWIRLGHSVTVVAASYSHVRSRQPHVTAPFSVELIDGIRYVWCTTPAYEGNGARRVVNMFSFLRRLGEWRQWLDGKPDIVIASSTYPLDIYPARRIARHHGARLVWEVHDLWPLSPIELGKISPWHPFMLFLQHAEDSACRSADVVVSMLPKADAHLRSHGMAAEKFFYVPNGVHPAEWSAASEAPVPTQHAEAIAKARAKGHVLVGYTGSHGVANALGNMLDAAGLTRNAPITWLLVGSGTEKAALAKRAAEQRLQNVIMLDPVPKAAIPKLLRAMDLLFIGWHRQPIYRFGISPNKLMDYMMAGVPVVHAVEAGNDPVRDADCGITIAPDDPQALAEAVVRLAAMAPADRRRMGENGRRYAELHHIYPVLAQRFLDRVLKSTAQGKQSEDLG